MMNAIREIIHFCVNQFHAVWFILCQSAIICLSSHILFLWGENENSLPCFTSYLHLTKQTSRSFYAIDCLCCCFSFIYFTSTIQRKVSFEIEISRHRINGAINDNETKSKHVQQKVWAKERNAEWYVNCLVINKLLEAMRPTSQIISYANGISFENPVLCANAFHRMCLWRAVILLLFFSFFFRELSFSFYFIRSFHFTF